MPTIAPPDAKTDPYVRSVMERIRRDPLNGLPALEIALHELALYDLWANREAIAKGAEVKTSDVAKFARALTLTYVKNQENRDQASIFAKNYIAKQRQGTYITIPTYERKDGVVVNEHRRRLPEGHTARDRERYEEIREELREAAEYQKKVKTTAKERSMLQNAARGLLESMKERDQEEQSLREGFSRAEREAHDVEDFEFEFEFGAGTKFIHGAKEILDTADSIAESVFETTESNAGQAAIREFLQDSSIGTAILAVVDFLTHTKDTFQFAARAIREYGPIVGVRMAHAYFRYGGYDMPFTLNPDGEGYVTEHLDVLPPIVSREASREWAIRTLQTRLPPNEADQGHAEPPSEGFIIDKNGEIIAHGTGRGNDHFLPFSMRHLRKLRKERGVEYVRRRMFGGPTTEDLHVAMLNGVDTLTVVSNGGVFTIDLSARSHGLKVEHGQILSRFHDLMDKRRFRKFQDYEEVLKAIQAEFPLHFRVKRATPGPWQDRDDRIGPKDSFLDQMRQLFNVPTQRERTAQSIKDRVTQDALQKPPWADLPGGMETWISQERGKGRPRSAVLRDVQNYGIRTKRFSNEFMARLAKDIEAAQNAEESRGVSQQPNYGPRVESEERAQSRAAQVAEAPYGTVITSTATKDDIAQRFTRAYTAFEEAGHDLNSLPTEELNAARDVFQQFENMPTEELEIARDSGLIDQIWDDLRG